LIRREGGKTGIYLFAGKTEKLFKTSFKLRYSLMKQTLYRLHALPAILIYREKQLRTLFVLPASRLVSVFV
jgi:hypothetical protein